LFRVGAPLSAEFVFCLSSRENSSSIGDPSLAGDEQWHSETAGKDVECSAGRPDDITQTQPDVGQAQTGNSARRDSTGNGQRNDH